MCADSTASGKFSASARNSFGVITSETLLNSSSCSVQRHLSQKEKKREPKRYAHDQSSDRRQPKKRDPQSFTFDLNEPNQHDCRNEHIDRKKRADPAGEQFMKAKREI